MSLNVSRVSTFWGTTQTCTELKAKFTLQVQLARDRKGDKTSPSTLAMKKSQGKCGLCAWEKNQATALKMLTLQHNQQQLKTWIGKRIQLDTYKDIGSEQCIQECWGRWLLPLQGCTLIYFKSWHQVRFPKTGKQHTASSKQARKRIWGARGQPT